MELMEEVMSLREEFREETTKRNTIFAEVLSVVKRLQVDSMEGARGKCRRLTDADDVASLRKDVQHPDDDVLMLTPTALAKKPLVYKVITDIKNLYLASLLKDWFRYDFHIPERFTTPNKSMKTKINTSCSFASNICATKEQRDLLRRPDPPVSEPDVLIAWESVFNKTVDTIVLATMSRLTYLETLLPAAAKRPQRATADIPLLTPIAKRLGTLKANSVKLEAPYHPPPAPPAVAPEQYSKAFRAAALYTKHLAAYNAWASRQDFG